MATPTSPKRQSTDLSRGGPSRSMVGAYLARWSARRVVATASLAIVGGAVIGACSARPDGAALGASVRDSTGVTLVDNPLPMTSTWRVDSAPVVTIGGLGDTVRFSVVIGVAVLGDRGILVADSGERSVRLFDSTGRLVRTVVGHGGGPDELYSITRLDAVAGDTIHVHDARTGAMVVLDPKARIVRRLSNIDFRQDSTRRSSGRPELVGVLDDGSFVTRETRMNPGPAPRPPAPAGFGRTTVYRRGAPDRGQLAEFEDPSLSRGERPPGWTYPMGKAIVAAVGDRLYYAVGDTLGFSVYSADGRLERIVRVRRPRVEAPRGLFPARDGRGRTAPAPPRYLPDVIGFVRDENGAVWLTSLALDDAKRLTPLWYVFDADGILRQIVRPGLQFGIAAIRADLVAGVATDQDDVPRVVVHRLHRD